MLKSDKSAESHLPLPPPIFHMLLALCDGERHGYALKRQILKRTEGKLNLGSGALYGSIARMLERGYVVESGTRPDPHLDDQRRRRVWSSARCSPSSSLPISEMISSPATFSAGIVTLWVIAGLVSILFAASLGPAHQARRTQRAPLLREA